jgi:hypothetical protein
MVVAKTKNLPRKSAEALTSLAYNIGPKAFATSSVLADVSMGNYGAATRDWMRYDHVMGTPLGTHDAGLHARREQEASAFSQGIHQEAHVTVTGVSDPHKSAEEVRRGMLATFHEMMRTAHSNTLRDNNNLGATPR